MRRTLPLLAAIGAVVSLACASAEPSYLMTDLSDDANAINDGQTLGLEPLGPEQTPVQLASADLLGQRITEERRDILDANGDVVGSELVALEARVKLTEEPTATGAPLIFRVVGTVDGCSSFLQTYVGGESHGDTSWRLLDPSCGFEDNGTGLSSLTVRSDAFSTTWDDEHSELVLRFEVDGAPTLIADRYLQDGVSITLDEVHVRTVLVAITAPVIDQMFPEYFAMYTIGEGPLQP